MVIYIHRSEIWSDLCDVSSFLLARFIITRSKSMCGFAWKFPFFFMPFWNWLKYRYETLWNKIAEPRRGHNLVHIVYFRFWQLNIFCNVFLNCDFILLYPWNTNHLILHVYRYEALTFFVQFPDFVWIWKFLRL